MKSWYWGITFCKESQTFVHNMAQMAGQWPQVTTEGGQAGMRKWKESHALSHSPSSSRVEREGGREVGRVGGLGHFLCLPHATQQRQLSHSKDDITWQHYWPSDSNKKKKYFYYLTTDNDIQMCLTSQSESQSESRQLRLHVHHSRAG